MTETVALSNLKFRAYHGLYPEEQVLGNDFVVNLKLARTVTTDNSTQEIIDYTLVYALVEKVMAQREDLLETVIRNLFVACKEKFSTINYLYVSLQKLHPPFGGRCEAATLTLEEHFG